MTALPCVDTTTSPLLVDEYLALQATRRAVDKSVANPRNQENLIRILRFFSCKRTPASPGSSEPGFNSLLRGENCHPFVYQECARRANVGKAPGTHWNPGGARRVAWDIKWRPWEQALASARQRLLLTVADVFPTEGRLLVD